MWFETMRSDAHPWEGLVSAPELMFFAIQAGTRLYGAIRRADIDATRAAALTIPLPRAPGVDAAAAMMWFLNAGSDAATEEVQALLAIDDLSNEQETRLVELYRDLRGLDDGAAALGASTRELTAIHTIRQWQEGEEGAPPSPLATIGGEVFNIAVDYFASTPGAVSRDRPEGRALLAVLETLDDHDFQGKNLSDWGGQIVLAVIGAVSVNPDLVSGGEREQLLVKSAAGALARSAAEHIAADLPSKERWRAATWLNLLGGAVLEGGVDAIGSNPALFLGVDAAGNPDPTKTVAFDVTKALADLLVGADGQLTTSAIGTAGGLHSVVRAAIESVAANPDVLGPDKRGVRTIVIGVLQDVLGDVTELPPDLGPELIRSILARTGENLSLVFPDAGADGAKNLLVVASASLLNALGTKPADGSWHPRLGREQVLGVVDTVLDAVVDDPGWLIEAADGASDDLGAAAKAAIQALAGTRGDRLTTGSAAQIIEAAVLAVIENRGLLARIPGPDDASERAAVTAVIEAVVATAFGDGTGAQGALRRARSSAVTAMTAAALDALARRLASADDDALIAARVTAVREVVAAATAATTLFDADEFLRQLEAALDAVPVDVPDGGDQ